MAEVAITKEVMGTKMFTIPLANGDYELKLGMGSWEVTALVQQAGGDSVILTLAPLALNGSTAGTYSACANNGAAVTTGGLTVTGAAQVRFFESGSAGGVASGTTFNRGPHVIEFVRLTVGTLTGTDEITVLATQMPK